MKLFLKTRLIRLPAASLAEEQDQEKSSHENKRLAKKQEILGENNSFQTVLWAHLSVHLLRMVKQLEPLKKLPVTSLPITTISGTGIPGKINLPSGGLEASILMSLPKTPAPHTHHSSVLPAEQGGCFTSRASLPTGFLCSCGEEIMQISREMDAPAKGGWGK